MFGISGMFERGRSGRRFTRAAGALLMTGLVAALLGSSATAAAAAPRHPAASSVAGQLNGVSCGSASSCVAVGMRSAGGSLTEVWNGSKWSVVSSPNPAGSTGTNLRGVDCTSAKNCLAVGSYNNSSHTATLPTAESWNGSKWSLVTVPAPHGAALAYLAGISCTSAKNCQAVGASGPSTLTGTLAESWNGSKWTIVPSPSPVPSKPSSLAGVACPASSECWAVGLDFAVAQGAGLTEKWSGSKWSAVTTPASKGGELNGDGCFSKSACMSVGIGDNGFVIGQRWTGSKWVTATPVNPSGAGSSQLNAVSCPASSSCQSVGNNSEKATLAEGWNGTKWVIESTPSISGATLANLAGVACLAASNCWAVGFSESKTATPLIYQWNGKTWSSS